MARSRGNRGGIKGRTGRAVNRGGGKNQAKAPNWPSKKPGKLSGPNRTNNPPNSK